MILPYLARLICICLAAFFVVHAAMGLLVSLFAPAAVRCASRMAPARGARLLLVLRLLPGGIALLVVAGLCTPSYLYLEPRGGPEELGYACLAAAVLCVAAWSWSGGRALSAVMRSRRHLRVCREQGCEIRLPGEGKPAWAIDARSPRVMLAGIVRPRIVISRDVVETLTDEQLRAVVRHEQAHGVSHDNLKRLVLLLAPGILPFASGFRELERAWAKLAEWAADDLASAGEARRSLSLAAALVRVARLGTPGLAPPLATSFMADNADLSERVDRLLRLAHGAVGGRKGEPILTAAAGVLLAGALVATISYPATLQSAHACLEYLIH